MNAKTITAAVLAVLIAVSLGMVVASEPSEAAPSDAESIDETMEFTALETYELDGRSLVFTEGGRLVFQEASVLSVNGSTHLEGSGTIITLMPGSVVSYMGNLYVVTETIDIGLDGSIDFVLDMDLLSDAPSGSFSVDISDGGEVTMLGGVTRGGPDKEAESVERATGIRTIAAHDLMVLDVGRELELSDAETFEGEWIPDSSP